MDELTADAIDWALRRRRDRARPAPVSRTPRVTDSRTGFLDPRGRLPQHRADSGRCGRGFRSDLSLNQPTVQP
jgi:hypothetical protein